MPPFFLQSRHTSTGLASQDLLIILPAKKSALLLALLTSGIGSQHSFIVLSPRCSVTLPACHIANQCKPTYIFLLRLFFFCAGHHCTKLSSTCSQKEHNSPAVLLECCCGYAVDYPVDTPEVHITSLSPETWLLVTH